VLTLLFAVHPANAQAVAWVPGRNDMLLALFILASLIFLSDYINNGAQRPRNFILFVFFFSAALFTKESALAAAVLIPLFLLAFFDNVKRKDRILIFFAIAVQSALYLYARNIALNQGVSNLAQDASYQLFLRIKHILYYIECAFFPYRMYLMSSDIKTLALTIVSPFILLIPLFTAFFFNKVRKKAIAFSLLWFFCFLAPSLMTPYQLLHSHRLYLPLIGIAAAFSEMLYELSKKYDKVIKPLLFLYFAFFAVFVFYCGVQSAKFENEAVFLANVIDESPNDFNSNIMVARYWYNKNNIEKAKEVLGRMRVNYNMEHQYLIDYYGMQGVILAVEKQYPQAELAFKKVLLYDAKDETALRNLANIYYHTRTYSAAQDALEQLVLANPENETYKLMLEEVKIENKNSGGAVQ
jgi:hypothetical protein